MIRVLHVVVPVHDEEALLGGCIDAIRASAAHFEAVCPGVTTAITVVLDSCTDASSAIAASRGIPTVTVDAHAVGIARGAGFEHAAATWHDLDAAEVWMISTDGDTEVPLEWIAEHHAAANTGIDLLVGAARPDPRGLHPRVLAAWHSRHHDGDLHVHGANLGIRLSAYRAVGGFDPVAVHEDVRLVARVRLAGRPWATGTIGATVTTSAREGGRAPAGFAAYLRALRSELLVGLHETAPGTTEPGS